MATIVFCPKPESGHLNPSFRLAKKLRARGHEVIYFVHEHIEPWVAKNGFATIRVPADIAVPTAWPLPTEPPLSGEPISPEVEARIRAVRQSSFESAVSGRIFDPLRDRKFDLLLVDAAWHGFAFTAYAHRQPVALYSVTLLVANDAAPPLDSWLMPDDRFYRLRNRLAWWRRRRHKPAPHALPVALGLTSLIAEPFDIATRLALPTLVMTPAVCDFSGISLPGGCVHGGPNVDVDREEPPFDWAKLDQKPGERLVYCSLGSQVYRYPGGARFFAEVLRMMAQRPAWKMVLAVGPAQLSARDVPRNVVVMAHAPQLQLLARADVAIVHGGVNSMKECIWFGVPMVCVPWLAGSDMPGSAARVIRHRIGLGAPIERITAARLERMVDTVLSDAGFAANIGRMRDAFRQADESPAEVEWVEAQARRPYRAPSSVPPRSP